MSGLIRIPFEQDIAAVMDTVRAAVVGDWELWGVVQKGNTSRICIVGGFYRDLLTNRPWRDVDVFIPGDIPVGEGAEELEYDLSKNDEFEYDGIKVNIITLQGRHTLESLLLRCDVGICQVGAYLDRPNEVYATQEFVDDLANKTLTVTRRTRWNHLERVQAKFPEHATIDHFQNHTGSRGFR